MVSPGVKLPSVDQTSSGPDTAWTCKSCFHSSVYEPVQLRQPDRTWKDAEHLRRCVNCKSTFGGTIEERLAYIEQVSGYKYFGDYEMSEEQLDAVYEAIGIAALVPDLLEAAQKALALIEDMSRYVGKMALQDYALFNEAPLQLQAAIAKTVAGSSAQPGPLIEGPGLNPSFKDGAS